MPGEAEARGGAGDLELPLGGPGDRAGIGLEHRQGEVAEDEPTVEAGDATSEDLSVAGGSAPVGVGHQDRRPGHGRPSRSRARPAMVIGWISESTEPRRRFGVAGLRPGDRLLRLLRRSRSIDLRRGPIPGSQVPGDQPEPHRCRPRARPPPRSRPRPPSPIRLMSHLLMVRFARVDGRRGRGLPGSRARNHPQRRVDQPGGTGGGLDLDPGQGDGSGPPPAGSAARGASARASARRPRTMLEVHRSWWAASS